MQIAHNRGLNCARYKRTLKIVAIKLSPAILMSCFRTHQQQINETEIGVL